MKILYIHQHFKTPEEPGGTRSYWIAKKLIEKGHKVYMLAASSTIEKAIETKIIDGINVIYTKVEYDNKMSIYKRLLSFLRFMFKSTKIALSLKDIDLVISTSTPLTVGFPALVLKKVRKIPYVFEVRDLWPEVPIQMGGLNNPLFKELARWFEKTIYKNAEYIVALSPGMKDGVISTGIKPEKVFMISNMAKIDKFYPRERNVGLMNKLDLDDESFKIIHFGALGLANGAYTIIESAKLLRDNNNIQFLFVGGGATEVQLKEECEKCKLNNVKFLGSFPMGKTSEIVNICDISIVSFLDLPILYTNSPNKLFDSLSAGKPIIVNSAGWTKDLVEQNGCGYYVNPNIPKELVDKVLYLKEHREVVAEMGLNSRKLAEEKYDKSILCEEFNSVVDLIIPHV